MKKNVSRIIALCLALVLALALVSCGDKKDDSGNTGNDTTTSPSASTTPSASPSDSGSSDNKTSSGKYATIDDYVKSPEVQAEIAPTISDAEASGMTMELYGEGDKLVYSFKYADTYDEDTVSIAKDALEAGLAEEAETFEQVASALKLAVDVDNPVVVVKYLNGDGSEIYSKEFTAK